MRYQEELKIEMYDNIVSLVEELTHKVNGYVHFQLIMQEMKKRKIRTVRPLSVNRLINWLTNLKAFGRLTNSSFNGTLMWSIA